MNGVGPPRFLQVGVTNPNVMHYYKGVSKNRGKPPKWMVKIMENPITLPKFNSSPLKSYRNPIGK